MVGNVKRLKIFQYFVSQTNQTVRLQTKQKTGKEDEQMIKELRNKVDFTSSQTILEFCNRKNQGKDPHYRTLVSDPFKLNSDDATSLREFVGFFIRQIDYLRTRYTYLSLQEQNLLHIYQVKENTQKTKAQFQEFQIQEEFYRSESKERIRKLLMFSEMIVFHALLLLMHSDYDLRDLKTYKREFEAMIARDFYGETTEVEKRQSEEVQEVEEIKEEIEKPKETQKKMDANEEAAAAYATYA